MWNSYPVLSVLQMSLVASLVILAVILIRELLKKAPKICSYVLWSVVLFRLLCPISITTPFSILPMGGIYSVELEQSEEIKDHTFSTGNTVISDSDGNEKSDEESRVGLLQQEKKPDISEETLTIGDNASSEADLGVNVRIGTHTIRFSNRVIWVMTAVWLVGMAVLLLYNVFSYEKLKRKLKEAIPLECAGRQNIYLSEQISTPFCMGFFRPAIYLPCYLNEKERSYIILHEQTHLKRGDHIMKLLAFFALSVHWFNPLVWLAFRLAGQDMEMSCDESVLAQMDCDIRAEYSSSLLKLAAGDSVVSGTPLGFGEGDTKARVKNVMNYKKPLFGLLIGAGLIVLLCIFLLGTNGNWHGLIFPDDIQNTEYKEDHLDEVNEVNLDPIDAYLQFELPSQLQLEDGQSGEWIGIGNGYYGKYLENKEDPSSMIVEATAEVTKDYIMAGGIGVAVEVQPQFTFDDGTISSVTGITENHMHQIGESESYNTEDFCVYLVEWEFDLYSAAMAERLEVAELQKTSRYWYAYLANEGEDTSYVAFLNADFFSKEEMKQFVESIHKKSKSVSTELNRREDATGEAVTQEWSFGKINPDHTMSGFEVTAADLYEDGGYGWFYCEEDATYRFSLDGTIQDRYSQNEAEAIQWKIYVTNKLYSDVPRLYEQASEYERRFLLDGQADMDYVEIPIQAGQFIVVYCSQNSYTYGYEGENQGDITAKLICHRI